MTEVKHSSLVKPTLETPFHIDFSWWRQNDQEWSVYLGSLLGPEYTETLSKIKGDEILDMVDPQTAEVTRVDVIQYFLATHFADNDDKDKGGSSLVESIFRVFLKNGNSPLSSRQLGEALERPPNTILRMLSGDRVYRGLRPILKPSDN